MNPAIFRAYDIRGVYPDDLTPEAAKRIGYAFAKFVAKKRHTAHPDIIIGRDIRASSDILRQSLVEGVISYGANCHDTGITTTPQLYFSALSHPSTDGGIMITASHNPSQYNGFKFALAGVGEVGMKEGLGQVKKLALAGIPGKRRRLGKITLLQNERTRYLKTLKRLVPGVEPLKIAVDAAGGVASFLLPELLSQYPVFYKPLFFNPDPAFKTHIPNSLSPEVDTLMAREMRAGSYQMGVSFDGDGDRVSFFDEKGRRIRDDIIFALLASETLAAKKKQSFVFELTHSRFLGPYIAAHGGKLHVSKVGGVHVRREMMKYKAALGGEISAHIYHRELQNIDSALLTMLKISRLVARLNQPLSRTVKHISQSAFRQFELTVNKPEKVLAAIDRKYKDFVSSRLDGISVQYPSWWFNIRMSQTEPILRLTIEAESEHQLETHWREVKKLIS